MIKKAIVRLSLPLLMSVPGVAQEASNSLPQQQSASAVSDYKSRERNRIEVLQRISPSVVCVMASSGEGGGSGVLISADGLAVSNYHVTSGSGNFMKCGLNDGRVYDAVIMGIDPTGDVALIQLLGRTDFPAAIAGNSDSVKAGDEVMALGNPFLLASDYSPTVTYGIVSGVRRYQYPADTFLEYTDCIQIDASINPGNSGGPLFDINGNWIGINGRASFEKRGRVNSGAAYAISVNQVLRFVDALRCGLIVAHGRTEFTVETGENNTAVISEVSQLSEAYRRGLRPRAQLLSFAGRTLTSANDFQNVLGTYQEGDRVPLTWRDDSGVHSATIRLPPLHSFRKAPELPSERQRRPGEGEDSEGAKKDPSSELSEELRGLYVERDGFCNFHFNQLRQTALLGPLKTRVAGVAGQSEGVWEVDLQVPLSAGLTAGKLVVSAETIGLQMPEATWLQQAADPQSAEEPPAFPGLLTAIGQLRKLFMPDLSGFSEVTAAGSTVHLPLNRSLRVLITRDGIRTARWYFEDASPLPVAVDVSFSAELDEARLIFGDWKDSGGLVVPGRLGFVDPATEEVAWMTVESAAIRKR
ncbi:MAG: putative serine protease HhoB precursor [Planctomycetota bacterium]